jgi:transcription elongation GreA/GreB family factor
VVGQCGEASPPASISSLEVFGMSNGAAQSIAPVRSWPLTREAWKRLVDEVADLRQSVSTMAGQGLEEGIVRLPVALAMRRLATITEVLDRCEVVDEPRCVAIGRRATLRDGDGEPMSFELVWPGARQLDQGRVSADSPLGHAILWASPGDVVSVDAPAGRWSATVVSVD